MNNITSVQYVNQPNNIQTTAITMPVFPGLQYYEFSQNPLQELALSEKARIRQEPELLEMLSGCETENRYHVFIILPNGMEKYLFKCKEESTFCQRNCCPSELREFNMKIKSIPSQMEYNDNFQTYFATLVKPFKCTCCCLARPIITGVFHDNNQQFGHILEECTCCDPKFVVSNNLGIRYFITIEYCQCGFCCRNGCSKFHEVEAQIRIGDGNGEVVGKIIKKVAQDILEVLGDADTYDIYFPKDASPEEKLTLIMATLFIDYRYYETQASSKKNKRSGRRRRSRRRRR